MCMYILSGSTYTHTYILPVEIWKMVLNAVRKVRKLLESLINSPAEQVSKIGIHPQIMYTSSYFYVLQDNKTIIP